MLTLAGLQRVQYRAGVSGNAATWCSPARRAIGSRPARAGRRRRRAGRSCGSTTCSRSGAGSATQRLGRVRLLDRPAAGSARPHAGVSGLDGRRQPIEPGQRSEWLAGLRDTLGVQDVEYYNIDPNTRVAGLLLAADYHMKLVGMGLAEGVPGVKSYLATVRAGPRRPGAADGDPAVVVLDPDVDRRGDGRARRVRPARQLRAGAERKRNAGGPRRARAHGPVGRAQQPVCQVVYRRVRGAGRQVPDLRAAGARVRAVAGAGGHREGRPGREGRLDALAAAGRRAAAAAARRRRPRASRR